MGQPSLVFVGALCRLPSDLRLSSALISPTATPAIDLQLDVVGGDPFGIGNIPSDVPDQSYVVTTRVFGTRLQLALRQDTGEDVFRMDKAAPATAERSAGTGGAQSVMRAVDILFAVAEAGPITLPKLSERLGLNEKTCFRIANALVLRGMLAASGRTGYRLGSRFEALASDYARQRGDAVRD